MNLFDQGYVELNDICQSISLAVGYPMTSYFKSEIKDIFLFPDLI
jgi:hypothetical protein